MVTTRSRVRRKPYAEETEIPAQGEKQETVGDSDHEQEQWEVGHGLDDKLFVYNWRPEKKRLSQSQKRQNKKQFQNSDKDRPTGEETDGKSRLRSRRTTETPRDRRDTAWH